VGDHLLGVKGATQDSRLARKHPAASAHRFVQLIRTLLRVWFGFVPNHLFGNQPRGVTVRLRPQANHRSPDAWQGFDKMIHLHAAHDQGQFSQRTPVRTPHSCALQRPDCLLNLLGDEDVGGIHISEGSQFAPRIPDLVVNYKDPFDSLGVP
jgi:hypothetical protein